MRHQACHVLCWMFGVWLLFFWSWGVRWVPSVTYSIPGDRLVQHCLLPVRTRAFWCYSWLKNSQPALFSYPLLQHGALLLSQREKTSLSLKGFREKCVMGWEDEEIIQEKLAAASSHSSGQIHHEHNPFLLIFFLLISPCWSCFQPRGDMWSHCSLQQSSRSSHPPVWAWLSYRDYMFRGMGTLLPAILRAPCTEGLMNLLILTEYTQKDLTTATEISEGARQCVY